MATSQKLQATAIRAALSAAIIVAALIMAMACYTADFNRQAIDASETAAVAFSNGLVDGVATTFPFPLEDEAQQ